MAHTSFDRPRREPAYAVYFVLDTSGGMRGARIARLSNALRAWRRRVNHFAQNAFRGELTIKVGVLAYDTSCAWMSVSGPQDLCEQVDWPLYGAGARNVGAALDELDGKMRPDAWPSPSGPMSVPIVYFVTGGYATDDYKSALERIDANWSFKYATRIGFALGPKADVEMVGDIVGDPRLTFQTEDAGLLERLLYLTSTVALFNSYEAYRGIRLPDVAVQVARELAAEEDVNLGTLCPLLPRRRVEPFDGVGRPTLVEHTRAPETNHGQEQPDAPNRTSPSACKDEAPRVLKSEYGRDVRIYDQVQRSGNNGIYSVDYDGKRKALKMMDIADTTKRSRMKRQLLDMAWRGSPAPAAIWPLDVVCDDEGRVGFVMDYHPEGSCGLDELIRNSFDRRMTLRQAVDICLQICMNMLVLHRRGYVFPTLGAGCFLVSPWDGSVSLCNCDEIIHHGSVMPGWMRSSSPIYLAPELVMGKSTASEESDWHSLAVIVFAALLGCHPLEGGSLQGERPFDEERVWKTYGHGARSVFGDHSMFDDYGMQNPGRIQGPAARTWSRLPRHMRALFHNAFSRYALDDPSARPSEFQWMRELARFRSEILVCSCGNEASLDGSGSYCRVCECSVRPDLYMELPAGYRLPACPGVQLYACQLSRAHVAEEGLDVLVRLIGSRTFPHMIGLQNLSKDWMVMSYKGRERKLGPGDIVRVQPGMTFEIEGDAIPIRGAGEFESGSEAWG